MSSGFTYKTRPNSLLEIQLQMIWAHTNTHFSQNTHQIEKTEKSKGNNYILIRNSHIKMILKVFTTVHMIVITTVLYNST